MSDSLRCGCEENSCPFHQGACQQTATRSIVAYGFQYFFCEECGQVALLDLGNRVSEDLALL